MVKGFTLAELITNLAILSIISLISIGPIAKLIEKNKVSSDVTKIVNIITTTRSKAISKNNAFTICGEPKHKKCSRNWKNLKVINSSKEPVYQESLTSNLSSANWYAFQNKPGLTIAPTGYTAHQNGTLYLCHKAYEDLHRAIIVSKSGRVSVEQKSDEITKKCA